MLEDEAAFNSKVNEIIKAVNYHLNKQGGGLLAVTPAAGAGGRVRDDGSEPKGAGGLVASGNKSPATSGAATRASSSAAVPWPTPQQQPTTASRAREERAAAAAAATASIAPAPLANAPFGYAASAEVGQLHVDISKQMTTCREQAEDEFAWLLQQRTSGVPAETLQWYQAERKVIKLRGMYQDGIISAAVLNQSTAAILAATNAGASASTAGSNAVHVQLQTNVVHFLAVVALGFVLLSRSST